MTSPTTDPVDGYAVATTGLKKAYGHTAALVGLDLAVPTGVVYGFLGPNGAGKTTTIRCLLGLIHPDAGTMTLLGRPYTARDRRRLFDIGALIESPSFYPYLSGRDNLKVIARRPARSRPRAGSTRCSSSWAFPIVPTVTSTSTPSGCASGWASRRRCCTTRSCSSSTSRPTWPDPAGIHSLRAQLRYLADTGHTILVSSHILPEVQQLADVVGIIDKGHLVHQGSLDELLKASGGVRVRLLPDEVERARAALGPLAGPDAVNVSERPRRRPRGRPRLARDQAPDRPGGGGQ